MTRPFIRSMVPLHPVLLPLHCWVHLLLAHLLTDLLVPMVAMIQLGMDLYFSNLQALN